MNLSKNPLQLSLINKGIEVIGMSVVIGVFICQGNLLVNKEGFLQ